MLSSLLLSSPSRVGFSKFELGSGRAFKFELRVGSGRTIKCELGSGFASLMYWKNCQPKKMLTSFTYITTFAVSLKKSEANQKHLKS